MRAYELSPEDFVALVEAVRRAEEVKPSQQAKRDVFRRFKILGSRKDPPLTAIFYRIMKRQGVIDMVLKDLTKVTNPLLLDPLLRAALRVAIELEVFSRGDVRYTDFAEVRNRVSAYLSSRTHPYVGMYFWEVISNLRRGGYKLLPRDEGEELMIKYLLPTWYIGRVINLLGRDEAERLFENINRKPKISVRVNTLKATTEEVLNELRSKVRGIEVSKYVPTVIKFEGPYNFDKSQLFKLGKIVIQEEAAAVASIVLDPKPGEVVVDLCAAPGGKTQHIGELMRNEGVIHAFDIDEVRIERMRELLRRTGITIVKIYVEDGRRAPKVLGEGVADRVLVDAPCTSDGTIPKNPELRWRIMEEEVPKFTQLQYELVRAAVKLLKPGGKLLYTTCSMLREEGEDVIQRVISKVRDVKLLRINGPYDPGFLDGTMRAWPHRHGTIGFFYALLEKVGGD